MAAEYNRVLSKVEKNELYYVQKSSGNLIVENLLET